MAETIARPGCKTCEFCDTDEATRISVRGSNVRHVVVGVCTLAGNFFHGKHVPDWIKGCPDREARTEPRLGALTSAEYQQGMADLGYDTEDWHER
jgi:hypothetical protein